MYPPKRINGFDIWLDDVLHIRQVDVPQLDKLMDHICEGERTEAEYDTLFERHKKMWDKMAEKAVGIYWDTVVSNATR